MVLGDRASADSGDWFGVVVFGVGLLTMWLVGRKFLRKLGRRKRAVMV
jgi:hypothetical protein